MPKISIDRLLIDKNTIVDKGDGLINFNRPVVISDDTEHWDGKRYDIESMDISKFDGKLRSDHWYGWEDILGKVHGLAKQGKQLVVNGFQFAIDQSPKARLAYSMVLGGFATDLSVGVMPGEEREDGKEYGATLVELSLVGMGNNPAAKMNESALAIVRNTIEQSEADGLDAAPLRKLLPIQTNSKDNDMTFVTIKNGKDFAVKVSYKNAAGEVVETELAPGASLDVSEDQQETVENQLKDAKAPKAEDKKVEPASNGFSPADLETAVQNAIKPLQDKVGEMEKSAFNNGAKEPEFKINGKQVAAKDAPASLKAMDWHERGQAQVENFYKATKQGDLEARSLLTKINTFHLDQLKESGLVKNAITLGDFGNFVTSPEMLTQIQGYRSDYSEILRAFPYRETNSLRLAWLGRSGDIEMDPVEMCDDDADGNLKPVKEYTATANTKDLEELAAVTPICNAATIFLAADLLDDATRGYRNAYDRNKARGIVSALEEALETDASQSFGWSASGVDTPAERLEQIRKTIFQISQGDGVLVMNEASWSLIWSELVALGNGGNLTDTVTGDGRATRIWSKNVVVTPNDLLPTLGDTGTYKSFAYDGDTTTVNHAIFYVNPANVAARENGGLRFDLSTDAAYEVGGEVKSAFQRNEIVLRGSHFRGTAVLDPNRVGGVRAGDVIS